VLQNPLSGERIVIRADAAETNGELLAFDLFLPPGGHVPAGHTHPIQEERFTILEGTLRFRLGRRTIVAHSGQTVRIPPGAAHWFENAAPQPARASVEVRPALRMQEVLERSMGLDQVRLLGRPVPRLPDLALVLLEFERELGVPFVPRAVVRLLLTPLVWLGQRRALAPGHPALEP
jgi:quercetin dioxygenase-like cupin family protein